MGDMASAGILLKAVGMGIVPGMTLLVFLVILVMLRFLAAKQEKDRAEHMTKWDSMVKLQDKVIATQRETVEQVITGSREDLNRLYELYDRQTKSLEVISHHITTLTNVIERKTICPNDLKQGGKG